MVADRPDESECGGGGSLRTHELPEKEFFKELYHLCGKLTTQSIFSEKTILRTLMQERSSASGRLSLSSDTIEELLNKLVRNDYLKKTENSRRQVRYSPTEETIYCFYYVHSLNHGH